MTVRPTAPLGFQVTRLGMELFNAFSSGNRVQITSQNILRVQFPPTLRQEPWIASCLGRYHSVIIPADIKEFILAEKPPEFVFPEQFTNFLVQITFGVLFKEAKRLEKTPPFLDSPALSKEYLRKHFKKPRPEPIDPYLDFLNAIKEDPYCWERAARELLPEVDFPLASSYAALILPPPS